MHSRIPSECMYRSTRGTNPRLGALKSPCRPCRYRRCRTTHISVCDGDRICQKAPCMLAKHLYTSAESISLSSQHRNHEPYPTASHPAPQQNPQTQRQPPAMTPVWTMTLSTGREYHLFGGHDSLYARCSGLFCQSLWLGQIGPAPVCKSMSMSKFCLLPLRSHVRCHNVPQAFVLELCLGQDAACTLPNKFTNNAGIGDAEALTSLHDGDRIIYLYLNAEASK